MIGGGIAGLVAAYELRNAGHDVSLLEASGRCGGRIYTHRFDAQNYGDCGAMRIPLDHHCTWKYIKEFHVEMDQFVQENANALYFLRGQRMKRAPWLPLRTAHPTLYQSVRTHVGDPPPDDVLGRWISQLQGTLPNDSERWEAFASQLTTPRLRSFDRFSVWQHVQGILPPIPPGLLRSTLRGYALAGGFLNDEEWEYVGRATSMLWDEKVSYLEALADTVAHYYPFMCRVVGGMEKLVKPFERALRAVIHRNAPVTALQMEPSGVRVHWREKGEPTSDRFDYAVCTVPAGAVARIDFTPALNAAKYEALTNVSYQAAAKSLVLCKTRSWELQPDPIFGGRTRTDLPIQECWYPSDNSAPNPNPTGPVQMRTIDYPNGAKVDLPIITEWVAKDAKVSKGPGVLLTYMRGTNARRFASMTNAQREAITLDSLSRLHPGIQHQVVEIKHWSWDAKSNPGGGAWAAFMPGERGRYQAALVAPYPTGSVPGSRVFFAGEHLGICHAWIQAAIQTAQGAVWHIQHAP